MKYWFLLLPICLSVSATSQDATIIHKVDELVTNEYAGLETGSTILISKEGQVIFHKAFGIANVELSVPTKVDNVFQIASMTKQFTAVCILMLMEDGKVALSDPITKYLKDFPGGDQITIHHLLTHTSGISNDFTVKPWNELMLKKDFAPLEFIDYFKGEPKASEPGAVYRYNNFGYIILGAIIENVAGMSYADFLRKHIFIPLEMNNSYVKKDHQLIKNVSSGYTKEHGELTSVGYYSPSQAFAAGNMMSTVGDLYKWNRAIQTNKLISEESKRLAFTNHKLNDGSKINYGYGWFIDEVNGLESIEHAGGIPGFRSNGIYLPNEKVFVAILNNCDCNDPRYISKKIAAVVAGKPYEEPTTDFDTDEVELQKWVGQYTFNNGDTRSIYLKKGQLYYILPNRTELKMLALSNESFILENSFTRIDFKMVDDLLVNMYTKNGSSEKLAVKEYQTRVEINLPSKQKKKFVGEYQLFPDFSLTISLKDDQLKSTGTDQEPLDIFPECKTRFFFKSIDAYIDFYLDKDGKCKSLEITQDGKAYSGTKIK